MLSIGKYTKPCAPPDSYTGFPSGISTRSRCTPSFAYSVSLRAARSWLVLGSGCSSLATRPWYADWCGTVHGYDGYRTDHARRIRHNAPPPEEISMLTKSVLAALGSAAMLAA